MTEIAWEELGEEYGSSEAAVTVGVFDGLHVGHERLIDAVVSSDWMPVVVTFQRHPSEVLLHDTIPGFIMSVRQKRALLRAMGIEVCVVVDFNESFRTTPGASFLRSLEEGFDLRRLVVGHDFRCGHRLDTGLPEIRAHFHGRSTDVVGVGPVRTGEEPVSSTRIRRLILDGDLAGARALLGRPYTLDVGDEDVEIDRDRCYVVKNGAGLLPESRQLLPPPGAYPVELVDGPFDAPPSGAARAAEPAHPGVLEIGRNSVSWPLVAGRSIHYIVMKDVGY